MLLINKFSYKNIRMKCTRRGLKHSLPKLIFAAYQTPYLYNHASDIPAFTG